MKVRHYDNPFPFMVIDEFYSSEELKRIWCELEFLSPEHKWDTTESNPEDGALSENGQQLKQNRFRWLDSIYRRCEDSDILTFSRKILENEIFGDTFLSHNHWFFRGLKVNICHTLLSYYGETGDQYKRHYDYASVTCLTWFYKEPKQFDGGDLSLYYNNDRIDISIMNNRILIFPSSIDHQAHPITTKPDFKDGDGRYCLSQFLYIIPEDMVPGGNFSWK